MFTVTNPAGIRWDSDLTRFFQLGDPLSAIAGQNEVQAGLSPLFGQVISPRLEQPYSRQTNIGWAHQLTTSTALTVDLVRTEGRDINIRFRPNYRVDGGPRRLTEVGIRPNTAAFRTSVSEGEGLYRGLIVGLRRRMTQGIDFSAVIQAPWGIQVSPFFIYRSALPIQTFEGIDLNNDANVNDITAMAYRFTGLNDDGTATFEENGTCESVNCSRGAAFSQFNLRVSKGFRVVGTARVEAIAEVFNLFNAGNPAFPLTSQRADATGAQLATFMQPTNFAGDFRQPEQRVGQIGFRFTF